jgi:UDP-N-acetylglucosamine/UDP-N-acetylgalactosamine diphosphorylase
VPGELAEPADFVWSESADQRFADAGREMLAAGRVAVVMLAGGSSTRMGGRFRGDIRVGPVSDRTLIDLHGEHIAALKARYAPALRWLIMTSGSTREPMSQALRRRDRFGLADHDVWLMDQPSLPVFDDRGEPLLRTDGDPICAPTGHGGLLTALHGSGFCDRLAELGVDFVFVFQYPNVLERICDVGMLGYHARGGHDVTVKGVIESRPLERVGRIVQCAGRTVVVEYHADAAPEQQRRLETMPMFTGTAVWTVDFLRTVLREDMEQPFHVVPHREPGVEGRFWKVEQLLFDLLEHSTSTGIVLGRRSSEYAVIKNEFGVDTVEAAQQALTARYRGWLDAAGAVGPADVSRIEISSACALSAEDLQRVVSPGFRYKNGLLLA